MKYESPVTEIVTGFIYCLIGFLEVIHKGRPHNMLVTKWTIFVYYYIIKQCLIVSYYVTMCNLHILIHQRPVNVLGGAT